MAEAPSTPRGPRERALNLVENGYNKKYCRSMSGRRQLDCRKQRGFHDRQPPPASPGSQLFRFRRRCQRTGGGHRGRLSRLWRRDRRNGAEAHRDGSGRAHQQDRKSVVEGKSVSVRVDLGGRRILKKKKKNKKHK